MLSPAFTSRKAHQSVLLASQKYSVLVDSICQSGAIGLAWQISRSASSMGSIIREWLPPPVAEAAKVEDPARFRAIFKALGDEWHANKDLEAGQRGLETLKWVAIVSG